MELLHTTIATHEYLIVDISNEGEMGKVAGTEKVFMPSFLLKALLNGEWGSPPYRARDRSDYPFRQRQSSNTLATKEQCVHTHTHTDMITYISV